MQEPVEFSFDMSGPDLDIFLKTTPTEELTEWYGVLARAEDRLQRLRKRLTPAIDYRLVNKIKEIGEHIKKASTKPVMAEPTKKIPEPILPQEPSTKNKAEQNIADKLQKVTWELTKVNRDIKELEDMIDRLKRAEIIKDEEIKKLEEGNTLLLEDLRKYRRKFYNERQKIKKEEFDV